jgi:hypothetical protein
VLSNGVGTAQAVASKEARALFQVFLHLIYLQGLHFIGKDLGLQKSFFFNFFFTEPTHPALAHLSISLASAINLQ